MRVDSIPQVQSRAINSWFLAYCQAIHQIATARELPPGRIKVSAHQKVIFNCCFEAGWSVCMAGQAVTFLLRVIQLLFLVLFATWSIPAAAQENAVILWNNAALQEIRYFHPGPTINSRALAIVHTCMYDAWAEFDAKAVPTTLGAKHRRPAAERTELNKRKAVSFAAYRCLSDLYPTDIAKFQVLMTN